MSLYQKETIHDRLKLLQFPHSESIVSIIWGEVGVMQQRVDVLCVWLLSKRSCIVALERSSPLFVRGSLSLDM